MFKNIKSHSITGPKMTSREDREFGNMKNMEEQVRVSVYTRTQLTEGSCNGCLHLDPALLQFHQVQPIFNSSSSIRNNPRSEIILCAAVCSPSSQTVVTLNVAKGVTHGSSPAAAYHKRKFKLKGKVRLSD